MACDGEIVSKSNDSLERVPSTRVKSDIGGEMPTRQVREARPRESAVTIVYQVEPGVDPGLMVCVKQMPVSQ